MSETKTHGRVKWFSGKRGFGFITPLGGGEDVFVHHTGLSVSKDNISRYLVEGECVSYSLANVDGSDDRVTAAEVTGADGVPLVCEARASSGRTRPSTRRAMRGANQTKCPMDTTSPCGWKLVKDAETLEDKVFADADGVEWKMVRHQAEESTE